MVTSGLNSAAGRHSTKNRIARLIWGFVWGIMAWTPRPAFRFRTAVARCFGANLGHQVHLYPSCRIWAPWNLTIEDGGGLGDRVDCYCVAPVHIGGHAVISQDVSLCAATHDYNDPAFPLQPKPIRIGRSAWIAAGAFIGPGVTVGEGAVVGARAVVVRDVPPWTVVAGNPARTVRQRKNFLAAAGDTESL